MNLLQRISNLRKPLVPSNASTAIGVGTLALYDKRIALLLGCWELAFLSFERYDRSNLFEKARREARQRTKLFLVIGDPKNRHGCGDVTIDWEGAPGCSNVFKDDLHDLSRFPDNYFGSTFVGHVMEHVSDPFIVMNEITRVTEGNVYVAYPRWFNLMSWLYPGHWWIITKCKNNKIEAFRNPLQ